MNEALLLRELVPAEIGVLVRLGVLVRRGADFASAEDAVQAGLDPDDPPRDPKAWLVAIA